MKRAEISLSGLFYCIQLLDDERRRISEFLETNSEDTPGYADYQVMDIDYEGLAQELQQAYEKQVTGICNYPTYHRLVMLISNSWEKRRKPGELPASLRPPVGIDGLVPDHVAFTPKTTLTD